VLGPIWEVACYLAEEAADRSWARGATNCAGKIWAEARRVPDLSSEGHKKVGINSSPLGFEHTINCVRNQQTNHYAANTDCVKRWVRRNLTKSKRSSGARTSMADRDQIKDGFVVRGRTGMS
jgi:hypothetical protein